MARLDSPAAGPPAKKARLSKAAPLSRSQPFTALLNGQPAAKHTPHSLAPARRVNEAKAIVSGGIGGPGRVDAEAPAHPVSVIEISSGDEESDGSAEDDAPALANGASPDDGPRPQHDAAEPEELSFGERLKGHVSAPAPAPHVVDVEAAMALPAESRELATVSDNKTLVAPSADSLGTLLTQALTTDDQELMESCLRVIDVDTIYATVERLPSRLVGILLHKLAKLLHNRPGRAGMLMVWVQWSLAAHGGYLACQPQLVELLADLNKVLKERASSLHSLLALKGRLDMVHAQLELRKRNQARAVTDHHEPVIFVEGDDGALSGDEPARDDRLPAGGAIIRTSPAKRARDRFEAEKASSDDEMPLSAPAAASSADDDDSEDSDDSAREFFDDEAEETDMDTGDDMSLPESDDLDDDAGASDSDNEKPPRPTATARRRF